MDRPTRRHVTPAEAARILGVSYPTIKQWIYRKRIRSVRTPGGHHRIPWSEIERLGGGAPAGAPSGLDAISGRNKLAGVVRRIRTSGLLSEVTIDVGDQTLTAIITKAAVQELRLRVGTPAVALIKATEVMVIKA